MFEYFFLLNAQKRKKKKKPSSPHPPVEDTSLPLVTGKLDAYTVQYTVMDGGSSIGWKGKILVVQVH